MNAGTHIVFASALYLGGAALFEYRPDLIGWGLAAGASVLPDIDLPTSTLGRTLFWLSTRLERRFGHRTLTHSLLALVAVGILASPLYLLSQPAYWWAVLGGYWSHLWIDMTNLRGVDLYWPTAMRSVWPRNMHHRMEVGSKAEMVLQVALLAIALLLYPVSGIGLRHGLANLLGNFDMARNNYLKDAGQHWYSLNLTATDNLTLERVQCDCPVVGTWRSGLIVLQGDQLRAIGENQETNNLYPLHVALVEGQPLRVLAQRVDMRGRSLRWLVDQIGAGRTYYLSGELRIGSRLPPAVEDIDRYRPARFTGDVLRLHYARGADLGRYLGMVAAEGEVFVQFWLRPGDPAVELQAAAQGETGSIPEELRGYL